MKWLDDWLNRITMYRLVLYELILLLVLAFMLCLVHVLPYSPVALVLSVTTLLAVGLVVNQLFAWVYKTVPGVESVYISALILALIITPGVTGWSIGFLVWAAILMVASKFWLTWQRQHLFNPAAVAVAVTAVTIHQSASWWAGMTVMLPFVALGGFLVVRKIRRADMVLTFFAAALLTTTWFSLLAGRSVPLMLERLVVYSPLVFFGTVMLTEPMTTPPTRRWQIIYGALIGILVTPQVHVGSLYSTPELALLVGNLFSFVVAPKFRAILKVREVKQVGEQIVDFIFELPGKLPFRPGQYMEWTLPVERPDDRGNRRYFTLASSPTESTVRLGVKFYPKPSRFKEAMLQLKPGDEVIASQVAGSFTLPKNPAEKCVFMAGGIGVTPYRSMVQYLMDTRQQRDIVLIYSVALATELVYAELFEAARPFGVRTVYTLTAIDRVPAGWRGQVGFVDAQFIQKMVPDFTERTFYLSGPHSMVVAFEEMLAGLRVPRRRIHTDYFPGFA